MAFPKRFSPSAGTTPSPGQIFDGFTSSIRDLLWSKDHHLSSSGRRENVEKMDGKVKIQIEEENEEKTSEDKSPDLCAGLHASVHHKETTLLCAPLQKVYRFPTEDQRWLTVRDELSETPLSFSLPRQLLRVLVHEHRTRIQEIKDLGELPPQWERRRCDVIEHCNNLIGSYQETLVQLDRLSGEQYQVITFGAPADHHRSFGRGGLSRLVKTTDCADSSIQYSPQELSRATELLSTLGRQQPLLFGLAEELLSVCLELNVDRLQEVMHSIRQQTQLFLQTLNDELLKKALLEINKPLDRSHAHSNELSHDITTTSQDSMWANVAMSLHCIIVTSDRLVAREHLFQQTTSEQEEVSTGGNSVGLASSLAGPSWQELLLPLVVTFRDCVREAVGRVRTAVTFVLLQGTLPLTAPPGFTEIVQRRHAVFSQALSAAVCGLTLKLNRALDRPGFLQQLQTVGLLVQFQGLLSTYGVEAAILEDMEVGVADLKGMTVSIIEAKTEEPEDLLPTISGTWGSLVVEVPVLSDVFVLLPWKLKAGSLIQIHPIFFNIGFGSMNQCPCLANKYVCSHTHTHTHTHTNDGFLPGESHRAGGSVSADGSSSFRIGHNSLQERLNLQSSRRLRSYCSLLRDELPDVGGSRSLWELLDSLECSVGTQRRRNGDVLQLAAMVCHAVNGVRLTSCQGAEDRTAMSVTRQQCTMLRERHLLSQQHFNVALDCMRRSRVSWGQIRGCYNCLGLPVCVVGMGDSPPVLQGPSFHLYPVAILLVTSHLLVLWLIISLVLLVAK